MLELIIAFASTFVVAAALTAISDRAWSDHTDVKDHGKGRRLGFILSFGLPSSVPSRTGLTVSNRSSGKPVPLLRQCWLSGM
jgi:hypothetical protein